MVRLRGSATSVSAGSSWASRHGSGPRYLTKGPLTRSFRIPVDDLSAATEFFVESGLVLVSATRRRSQGENGNAPANAPGIRHIAFVVEDIDVVITGLRARGAARLIR